MVRAAWTLTAATLAVALLHAKSAAGVASFRGIPSLLEMEAVDGDVYARDALLATYGEPPPEGCTFSDWAPADDCDATKLVETFTRKILTGGADCGPLSEQRDCRPVHCQMSTWSEWSPCNEDGAKTRTREIEIAPKGGGRACPHAKDTVQCRDEDCLTCPVGDWTCHPLSGKKTRARRVTRRKELGGKECVLQDVEDCDPVDCEVDGDKYEAWSTCSNGKRTRKHKIKTHPVGTGLACPQDDEEACSECEYESEEEANDYDECTERGNSGKWFKHKKLHKTKGGAECVAFKLSTEDNECEKVDCEFYTQKEQEDHGGFAYGTCKTDEDDDDNWYQLMKKEIKTDKQYGGQACESEPEDFKKKCSKFNCPPHCGGWGKCDRESHTQTRTCDATPGYECPLVKYGCAGGLENGPDV